MRILDLSWPVAPGMPLFPGDPPVECTPLGSIKTNGYLSHLVRLPAHSGTHIDAPGHVLPGGAMLADLAAARFCGPGVALDLRARPGLAVTEADLAPHMARLADERPAFVLLATGGEALWGGADYYTSGPFLTPGAAGLLASLPGLSGIGLDSGSADPLAAADLPAHHALLDAGVLIVENLRGLGALPRRGFTFLCLPVLGGDGSPVRAAALLPSGEA